MGRGWHDPDGGHGQRDLAHERIIIDYIADPGFYPYGTKAQDELIPRVLKVIAAYLKRRPDGRQLIVACNTASTLCLDALRQQFALPIIGVVPALKPACAATDKPQVGLLATEATIDRAYVDALMADYGQGKALIKVGSPQLVELAEQVLAGGSGQPIDPQIMPDISHDLEPFRQAMRRGELDTIVLGCTHFPWLKATLTSLLPDTPPLRLLDSTVAIIRRSLDLLVEPALKDAFSTKERELTLQWPTLYGLSGAYYEAEGTDRGASQRNRVGRLFQHTATLDLS